MNLGPVRRSLVVACALPLLLSACSKAEPTPQMPDPTPTESSPSASESETAEPWEEKTEDGAVAFAKHWIDLFNAARVQFETAPLRSASTPACESCSNYARVIEQWRSDGTTYESKPWKVLQVGVIAARDAETQVALRISRPSEVITPTEGPAERNSSSRATYDATVRWSQGQWRMHELVIPQ